MKKKSNINIIEENEIKSEEYYNMYNSRDFYKGTSFKMAGEWTPNTYYFNDEHIIDFISYKGTLLYCLRGHISSIESEPKLVFDHSVIIGIESNPYWSFILGNSGLGEKGDKGDTGPRGPKGDPGITPQLKIENGRWKLSIDNGITWRDVGQATGNPGRDGRDGVDGTNGVGVAIGGRTGQVLAKKSNTDYDTVWETISDISNLSAEVVSAQESSTAAANVVLENETLKFTFGLPRGANGRDGQDGAPGRDGTDGQPGQPGQDGISVKMMYTKTSTSTTPPIVNKQNANPGSIWNTSVPIHSRIEFIWSITANFRDTTLIGEWSDPIKMTGDAGKDAKEPDYKVYVYKLADTKPDAPTGSSKNPPGWSDYPNATGNWWQCIGTVNGTTGLVTVWSEVIPVNGRDGIAQDGKYTEMRFAVNTSNVNPPVIDKTKRSPSGWSIVPPQKETTEYMWMTLATINPDNTLAVQWSTPTCISGAPGPQGLQGLQGEKGEQGIQGPTGANGRTSYFHIKYSPVADPTSSQMTETPNTYIGTYVDYTQADSTNPSSYTWARFEGLQGAKGEQGIPGVNGEDGRTSYLHIKYSNDGGKTFTPNNGEDSGSWIGIYTDYNVNDSSNPADYKWSKIKGEQGATGATGATGPAGSQGVSGIPGVGIELRYCIGTETTYSGSTTLGSTRNPTGWTTTVPSVTEAKPYIWFIQARITYTSNADKTGVISGTWSTPTILSGINGLDGAPGPAGKRGQIIYPEGIYSVTKVYQCTETKTPYVYDSGNANYWVLNKVGSWQGSLHSNQTPSTDTSGSWVKLEAFEALYTKIGIIANGLIGSAVFNDNWMFSQQGIDVQGDPSTSYEDFDPTAPMGPDAVFTPNIAFNFATGDGFLAAGKIRFYSEGTITATDLQLTGNSGFEPNTVAIDGSGRGTITELNSFIPLFDATIYLEMKLGKDNERAFTKGKVYYGSIVNTGGWYTEIDSASSSFDSIEYTLNMEPDGMRISAKVLCLRHNSTLNYLFIPDKYSSTYGYWVGTILIINRSDFIYNSNKKQFESKGIDYSAINSNIIAIGSFQVYSGTTDLTYYARESIPGFYYNIRKVSAAHWQIYASRTSEINPISDPSLLSNSVWIINPARFGTTIVSFVPVLDTSSASEVVLNIYADKNLPTSTGTTTEWDFIVFLRKS